MVTQRDTQKDYVVKVKGLKVDVIYRTPDVGFVRSFLEHVIKVASFVDLEISVHGPEDIQFGSGVTFCTTAFTNTAGGQNILWTDTSSGGVLGSADITI